MNTKSESFISAIEGKNLDKLKRLVKNGLRLNWMYFPKTVLPIVLAAETGDIEFCRAIVELGSHLHSCDGLPSPLSNAVYLNFKTAVEVLIRLGCDVNENCLHKEWLRKMPSRVHLWLSRIDFIRCPTSLALAVQLRNYDMVTALLDAGADINKSDNDIGDGVTPIHILCENRSCSCNINLVVEYFRLRPHLRPKPDLNCQNKFGETPLMTASRKGNVETVKFLLEEKVNLNAENDRNHTAMHYAVFGSSASEGGQESEKIILCLHRAGCAVDMPHWKDTPLNVIPSVDDKICEILLKFGADPLRNNGRSHTILHIAAKAGNMVLMNKALKAGISVDTISAQDNRTPLMLSLRCLVATKYLVQQQRARLDLKGGDTNETAFGHCLSYGPPVVGAYLIIEGSPRCIYSYYGAETRPRVLELLLLTEISPLRDLMSKYSSNWKKYIAAWNETWTETTFYQLCDAMASNVRSLKHLCRLVIRVALAKHFNGRGILLSIDCLPLPSILKTYICYQEELERLKLSKILNTDDDDDDGFGYVNSFDGTAIHTDDLRFHRHRQQERPYDQIDDVI